LIRRGKFPKVFFGWWTVLAGSFLSAWGIGYQVHGFSALFKPIASEFGFSRAVTAVAVSIGRLGYGLESPLTGWLVDRFGPRFIIAIGMFIAGLGLILMNFINSLWSFYVVWGVILGTGINIGLELPLDKAITSWFVKKRGMALSVRWFLTGLAGLVLSLVAWLISIEGWRITVMAGAFLLQSAGITAFLLNQTTAMIYVFLVLFWIGVGIALPLTAAVRARYFGRKAFGSIEGTSMVFLTPFGMAAPIYAGWVYDNTGSYITAFTLFAILFGISAILVSFAYPPKPPAHVTDVRKFL